MTECERIIREKLLPVEFFKEEYIDGFWVDEKRKKIWAVALDLLLEFDRVCKKHNLRYYVMYGSLLGVIRHEGGFIPWDDDMDVCMPREDYEKMLALTGEFNFPYFLQTPYNDEGYCATWIKLRNCNTSAISYAFRYEKFNLGIGLDIYPLDKCVKEGYEDRYEEIKKIALQCSGFMRRSNPSPSEEDKKRMDMCKEESAICLYEKIQKIARQFENIKTEYMALAVLTIYEAPRFLYRAEDFEEIEYREICGYKFPIPKNYDNILRTTYGNYMEFPPEEERGKWHGRTVIEPDVPYKELLERILPY